MKRLLLILMVACGGKQQPQPEPVGNSIPPGSDSRTPFEKRRDAACEHIAPKLTHCAVEDAQADFRAGKVGEQQYRQDTAPEIQKKNSEKFIEKCKGWRDMSSRQIRVLEVCDREETECGPLKTCLEHLGPEAK